MCTYSYSLPPPFPPLPDNPSLSWLRSSVARFFSDHLLAESRTERFLLKCYSRKGSLANIEHQDNLATSRKFLVQRDRRGFSNPFTRDCRSGRGPRENSRSTRDEIGNAPSPLYIASHLESQSRQRGYVCPAPPSPDSLRRP